MTARPSCPTSRVPRPPGPARALGPVALAEALVVCAAVLGAPFVVEPSPGAAVARPVTGIRCSAGRPSDGRLRAGQRAGRGSLRQASTQHDVKPRMVAEEVLDKGAPD